jgi:hypothetical protein
MPPDNPLAPLLPYLPFLLLLPILYFRMRKLSRPQPLKLSRLWIRPAIIVLAATLVIWAPQPGVTRHFTMLEWGALGLAAALGAVAGWHFGRVMKIEVHPEDGTLMTFGGQTAVIVMMVLILIRVGLRSGMALEAQTWHLDALLISDISLVFTAALFAVRGLEMYLRAQRVMAAAKP